MDEHLRQKVTERQEEVLDLLLAGQSEKQIARALDMSQHTVHGHVVCLYRIFDVATRSELLSKLLGAAQPPAKRIAHTEMVLEVDVLRARRVIVDDLDARTAYIRKLFRTAPTGFKVTAASLVVLGIIGGSSVAMRDNRPPAEPPAQVADNPYPWDFRYNLFTPGKSGWMEATWIEVGDILDFEIARGAIDIKIGNEVFSPLDGDSLEVANRGVLWVRGVGSNPVETSIYVNKDPDYADYLDAF